MVFALKNNTKKKTSNASECIDINSVRGKQRYAHILAVSERGGNGVVWGQSVSIVLIDGSGLKLIKPTALTHTNTPTHTHSHTYTLTHTYIQLR